MSPCDVPFMSVVASVQHVNKIYVFYRVPLVEIVSRDLL